MWHLRPDGLTATMILEYIYLSIYLPGIEALAFTTHPPLKL